MKKMTFLLLMIIAIFGCDIIYDDTNSMSELVVAKDFDYKLTNNVDLEIICNTRENVPIPSIYFAVYDGRIEENGRLITQGATDDTGCYSQVLNLPTMLDSLTIVGYMTTTTLPIINNKVSLEIGGSPETRGVGGNHQPRDGFFKYLTSYNNNGIPNDMAVDYIGSELLQRINASFPEYRPVPKYHPDYLSEGSMLNTVVEEDADVWITFVHEGAGYRNSLGFYSYSQKDGPPENPSDLVHTIIVPNVSIQKNGMHSGDKIHLGEFEAGTVIGWFLVANGWNGKSVSETRTRYYSNSEYNPEFSATFQQHAVLLNDKETGKFFLAFEDLTRPQGDDDFNDAVFSVTSNPIEAISTVDVNLVDEIEDEDNDGISDLYDDYPQDPKRAFDNFYPAENVFGTLAFEDYWPRQGDYDMNDLVVGYNFRNVHNPKNKLIDIIGTIRLRAIGGSYHSGFAIELPISSSNVNNFSGDVSIEKDNDNVIINVFDDAYDIISPSGEGFVNTESGAEHFKSVDINFGLSLNVPKPLKKLEFQPPYNPFLRSNGDIGREVHLPDYPPTSKADNTLFGTEDDNSSPGDARYYKTTNNLPWAINLPTVWNYPLERKQLSWGYKNFQNWAESSGTINQDWYLYKPENLNEEFVYTP